MGIIHVIYLYAHERTLCSPIEVLLYQILFRICHILAVQFLQVDSPEGIEPALKPLHYIHRKNILVLINP